MKRLFVSLTAVFLCCLAIPAYLTAQDAKDYFDRGTDFLGRGKYDKAITAFDETLRLADPSDVTHIAAAYFNRGLAWRSKGEYDKAIADYSQALRFNLKMNEVYANRGVAWGKKGEYGEAIADFNRAMKLAPKDAHAYNNLAWLYSTCPNEKYRDGKKAVENAMKAYQLDAGKHWQCIGTLAAAHAENGEFDKAQEWQEKAIALAKADNSATEKDTAEAAACLDLYKQGKPYREESK